MSAYYNEIDPFAAEWLRNLIQRGLIAPGDVDERSIADVQPDDLRGYRQVHFFAGIGGWSAALRLAGWPDDREVWTGSCPCQPFSAAGKRKGTADERHLWPEMRRLVGECRPATVFGEQVANADGRTWLAAVRADLEALGYAVGAADLCAASVGAPHIRQRLWWVADAHGGHAGAEGLQRVGQHGQQPQDGGAGVLADALHAGRAEGWAGAGHGPSAGGGIPHRLADRIGAGLEGHERTAAERGGAVGFWSDLAWLPCRDGKARPTQPGLQPLVNGVSGRVAVERPGGQGGAPLQEDCRWVSRVGALRGAGNAIAPQVAAEFIGAWADTDTERFALSLM